MDNTNNVTTTEPPPSTDPSSPTDPAIDPNEYNKIKQERDDYLITMCVFIVAFVVAECAAVYFWYRSRG